MAIFAAIRRATTQPLSQFPAIQCRHPETYSGDRRSYRPSPDRVGIGAEPSATILLPNCSVRSRTGQHQAVSRCSIIANLLDSSLRIGMRCYRRCQLRREKQPKPFGARHNAQDLRESGSGFMFVLNTGRSARRCGAAPAFRAKWGIQASWKNKSMSGRPALVRERELNKALSAALKVGAKEVRVDLGGGVSITIPLPSADEKPVASEEQITL